MTTGEKIAKLRKQNNYTQEQLADILEVSRQSISKWESDIAYPETDKLIRIGKLFGCSMDYLLNDDCTEPKGVQESSVSSFFAAIKRQCHERKSKKTLWGMPLYHIGRNANGFFAIGQSAKGIFAIGLRAHGVFSLGLFSTGVFSVGLLSIGLIALGTLALGLFSVGSIALGLFAVGAISIGILSIGALSVGEFSVGALATGKYVAIGDYARGMIAVGDTEAIGSVYQHLGALSEPELTQVKALIDAHVPGHFAFLGDFIKIFLS